MKTKSQFVVCLRRSSDEDILFGKIYQTLVDNDAEKEGLLRIVDESGEDYLYPKKYFAEVQLSTIIKSAFAYKG